MIRLPANHRRLRDQFPNQELRGDVVNDPPIHTYMHCRKCVAAAQTERLEIGLSSVGIRVDCRKHGLVGTITPEALGALVANGPRCDCCEGGHHQRPPKEKPEWKD